MISKVQQPTVVYTQQTVPKEDVSKTVQPPIAEAEALDKVAMLKKQIENGTYKVDIEKTAQAIVKELM